MRGMRVVGRMRGFLFAMVVGLALLAAPPAGTTQGSPLEVLPAKDCYSPGELVRFDLRNAGPGSMTWHMQPPPTTIMDAAGQIVAMPSQVFLQVVVTIGPGDTYPIRQGWNQTYYLYDPQGNILPPTWQRVLEGVYTILAAAHDPPVTGSAQVRIDAACGAPGPQADAGPDVVALEGQPVTLNGSGRPGPGADAWELRANITAPRHRFAHALLGGRVYVAGGDAVVVPPGSLGPSTTEVYDSATDTWTVLPTAGIGCGGKPGIAGAAVGGRFYAIGGYEGPCDVVLPSTEVLDEAAGRWLPRADMPTERVDHAVAVLNDKVYAVGGRRVGQTTALAANEAYDPATDTWETRAPMPTPRSRLAAVAVDNRIYALGGSAGNVVEVYNPETDTWESRPSIPSVYGRFDEPAVAIFDGRIYLVGVECVWFNCTSVVLVYNPATGDASSGPRMNRPRLGAGLDVVGDILIAVAGYVPAQDIPPFIAPVPETEILAPRGGLSYSWDANDRVDSDGNGNFTDDVEATDPTLAWRYGDDGVYTATLTVTDGGNRSARDTATVTVLNVAPRVAGVDISLTGGVADLGLRVAGRKWNAANLTLFRDDAAVAAAGVRRAPGSPEEQIAWIPGPFPAGSYRAIVTYEPADLGGREVGANPVWLVARDADGRVIVLAHHTFNVQRSEGSTHWNHIDPWGVDLSDALGPTYAVITVSASDDGSDDLLFRWSTGDVRAYFNDGVGPDPFPSPWGTFPFAAADRLEVPYVRGVPLVLQVEDDDGGATTITVLLS